MHGTQPFARHMRINLRRTDVGVAEHELYGAQVGTAVDQMGGERMTQGVWADVTA
jgi:hypothetical protein